MPINYPANRKEVTDRVKTDVQANLPSSQPFLPISWVGAFCIAMAGRIYDLYLQVQQLENEIFPDTATGISALRWGSFVNIIQEPAFSAKGLIVVTGTLSTILPNNTAFQAQNGNQYLTQSEVEISNISVGVTLERDSATVTATSSSDHHFASGQTITITGAVQAEYNGSFIIAITSATQFQYTISGSPVTPATGTINAGFVGINVDVESVNTGEDQNQPAGSILTLTTPLSGIDNNARVTFDEIGGGADDETITSYRSRYLYRYQNPHALFNPAEITTTAKKVAGVTRVWPFKVTPVVGDVTVYFVRDNDADPIPSPSEVTDVLNALLAITPANMDDDQIHVSAPTRQDVPFTFSALSPNTATMQAALTANLEFFFNDQAQVGAVDGSTIISQETYNALIVQTVDDAGARVESFTLSVPTGDIAVPSGNLPFLGTVTFP